MNIINELNNLSKDFYGEQVLNDEPNYKIIIAEKLFHTIDMRLKLKHSEL